MFFENKKEVVYFILFLIGFTLFLIFIMPWILRFIDGYWHYVFYEFPGFFND